MESAHQGRPDTRLSTISLPVSGSAALICAITFLELTALAFGQGGYYPVAWGWAALGFGWAALMALLLLNRIERSRLEWFALGAWLLLTLWTAASTIWSTDVVASGHAVELTIVYLTAAAALVLLGTRASVPSLLTATWASICLVSAYGLGTHILPDRFGYYTDALQPGRLYQPLGYWNAFGIFAVMGMLLALGICASRETVILRLIAGASWPGLAATVYFTFSRGAWLAMLAGVLGAIAISSNRIRYLATLATILPWTAIVVWRAWSSAALNAPTAGVERASSAGLRLAGVVALCTLLAAAALVIFHVIELRLRSTRRIRQVFVLAVLACAVVALAGVFARYGGPPSIYRTLHHDLTAPPPTVSGSLNARLPSLSLNGRPTLWRVGLDQFRANEIAGSGAGTFTRYWYAHRPVSDAVRDAHDLYIQTAAELGLVGLALLAAVLTCPLVAAIRVRSDPIAAAAIGAYIAYLAHVIVDWDWQMPAITLVAIVSAFGLLALARGTGRTWTVRTPRRLLLGTVVAVFTLAALVGLVGNVALSRGRSDMGSGHYGAALSQASAAERWMPWSCEPYLLMGQAQQAAGRRAQAAADYRRGLAKDPNVEDAWAGLSHVTVGPVHRHAIRQVLRIDPLSTIRR
jgi:O-Antigen ligase